MKCSGRFLFAWIVLLPPVQRMIDSSGKKIYNSDKEAHIAALDHLRKECGLYYEAR